MGETYNELQNSPYVLSILRLKGRNLLLTMSTRTKGIRLTYLNVIDALSLF